MPKATFAITAELMVEICKGLTPGANEARYYRVAANPLPADSRLISIEHDGFGRVVVTIDSNHVNEGDEIAPKLQAVQIV